MQDWAQEVEVTLADDRVHGSGCVPAWGDEGGGEAENCLIRMYLTITVPDQRLVTHKTPTVHLSSLEH